MFIKALHNKFVIVHDTCKYLQKTDLQISSDQLSTDVYRDLKEITIKLYEVKDQHVIFFFYIFHS